MPGLSCASLTELWVDREPFDRLPAAARRWLLDAAVTSQLATGTTLFREGEPSTTLWVLQAGWVRLNKSMVSGNVVTLEVVTPGHPLVGLSAFSGGPYVASAVAATAVVAIRLPAMLLQQLVGRHAPFAASALRLVGQRVHQMVTAYAMAFAPVGQRMAGVLVRLTEGFGETIPLTRRELAALTGTTVETAIRVTNEFRRAQLLQLGRGAIRLLDVPRMRDRALAA